MKSVDEIYRDSADFKSYASGYLAHLADLLDRLDLERLEHFCQKILAIRQSGQKMILCGNGGSASTASHFVNDFSIGTKSPRLPFKTLSLNDNSAVLTAIGNDFGYDQIFRKQLEVSLEDGDIFVVISASGNSENLIKAVEYAKQRGNYTVGLLGFDGGKLIKMVDLYLLVSSSQGDYGPVEDAHLIINHLLMNYFLRLARDQGEA